jgi:hypothetical protein
MMVNMKHREPVGLEANTPAYTFYVRTSDDTRRMLIDAREHVTKRFGAPPSNHLLFSVLLETYMAQADSTTT